LGFDPVLNLSVIIPVLNGAKSLPECLDCLRKPATPQVEYIVVDDGSCDGSVAIAEAAGAAVLRTRGRAGPATGRNLGAAHAAGDILVFVDADVCVRPDTLERIRARFENDPSIDAVFGSYDDEPGDPGFISQYKNLLHHHVHQSGRTEAATFWSGCGAVRRAAFQAVGGFDERYTRPSMEDIELGYRLRAAGHRIALDPRIQVKHLKRWGLLELARCDILSRALPWTRLILRSSQLPDDLNLAVPQRLTAILVLASAILAVIGPFIGIWSAWALLPLAAAIVLNRRFYLFLADKRGWLFLAGALPLHLAYYLYSTLAFAAGVVMHVLVWRRESDQIPSPAARQDEALEWPGRPALIVPPALERHVEPDK
jgi:cellulose synthase/poly-beta-1,6-N-acetylglucosamine synthase-like glycosyltransferase